MSLQPPSLPLVSIVTPAFNEEQYLAECIESILAQTYSNWDYTIVNNCSTDRTLEVAQTYAAKDQRIRIHSNGPFLPALANLNRAYRQISPASKYCKMVLADDWIFPECLECMVHVMEKHPSVGIVGAYGLMNTWVLWTGLSYPSHCVSGREICRKKLLGGPYVFGSPTSLMFRSDLVRSHDPFCNESNEQADSEACFELLKACDFGFVHQVLTFSRDERPGGRLTASRELNTAAPGTLHELIVYGPHYLTAEEYAECLKSAISKYYDFLAVSVLQRRPREFWNYHKRRLKAEGIDFSRLRVARALAVKPFGVLTSLKDIRNRQYWGL